MSAIANLESGSSLRVSAPPRELSGIAPAKEPSLYDFSDDIVADVRRWQAAMALMDKDGKRVAMALAITNKGMEGWSQPNIYKKYDAWVASGRDWKVLLNKKPFHDLWTKSEEAAQLPAEFIRWAGGQILDNQRASGGRAAWRGIVRQWRRWLGGNPSARILGYDTCPPVGPNGEHPLGWSYQNLFKKAQPPKVERVLARIGTAASKQYLPCVYGTRSGARWLEYIFFDDVQLDQEVIVPGYLHPVRMLQLGGLDYSTGIYFPIFGQRPELPGDDGRMENLKRKDFLWLVAALIDTVGYPAGYTMYLICERGTATMNQAEARVLYDISGGHIVVCYTSMNGQLVQAWDERKSGNSAGKACIESIHALLKNEMGNLRGQIGKDPDFSPAALLGMRREAVALGKSSLMLAPEDRARICMPYATAEQCYFETLEVINRINNRRDHALEGFDYVQQWRLKGTLEWHQEGELANLDPAIRPHLEWKPRLETPMERQARLSAGVEIARVPSNIWHHFYVDSHALKKVLDRGHIEVKLANQSIMFGPGIDDMELPAGTEVLAYFSPNNPQKAYLTVNGRFVCEWPRIHRLTRDDKKGVSEGIRKQKHILNRRIEGVQTKMAEKLLREESRMERNNEVIEQFAHAGLIDQAEADPNIPAPTPGAAALQEIGRRIAAAQQESRKMDAAQHAAGLADMESIFASEDSNSPEAHSTEPGGQETEDFLAAITGD